MYGTKDEEHRKRIAREEAIRLTRVLQGNYDAVYDKFFPGVRQRNEGRPNHDDFTLVMKSLVEVFAPIRAHRDTVVAHWDKNQQPATVEDLNKAMSHVEELLGAIYLITKLGQHGFELGGVVADVDRTARDLAELIMGPFRVRRAKPEDMTDVYMMGFDAWAEGQDKETYLKACRESIKYARGIWYVLEDRNGKSVSSLITYTIPTKEGRKPAIGLGSIATQPDRRRQGHAGQLIWEVLRIHHDCDEIREVYLWADVNPEFYEDYEFIRLPERFQTRPGSVAMIRAPKERLDALLSDLNYQPPAYF